MPRTPQQFEGIREERKSSIMLTALGLFAKNGFHGTTISTIAREAGISKGLLYNYFESKDDLIKTIIYSGLDKLDRLVDPDKDGVLTGDEMEYFLDKFFGMLQHDISFWKLYFTLFVQEPVIKLVRDRLAESVNKYIALLVAYFKGREFEDPYTEAVLFGAMLDGIAINYIANSELFPVEKIKERILQKYS
ncbi:MAG TPA: TetR/AcrR family transcriptional regulator [Bacteroidetes bacterium]|nr:TetR/AcrR family transcriptional regulator [Bacteroidota bacterium]